MNEEWKQGLINTTLIASTRGSDNGGRGLGPFNISFNAKIVTEMIRISQESSIVDITNEGVSVKESKLFCSLKIRVIHGFRDFFC